MLPTNHSMLPTNDGLARANDAPNWSANDKICLLPQKVGFAARRNKTKQTRSAPEAMQTPQAAKPSGLYLITKKKITMSKQIAITTRLVTRIDNEEEIIEQAVDGLLDVGPGNHLLRFTEQDQQTQVHLLVSEGRAQLRRNGSFSSAMRFTQGGRFESTYQTPHGPLQMHVVTKQYHTKHDTEGGTLETAYELYLSGRFISHNKLLITWKVYK